MAISQSVYVDITSGVGGQSAAAYRELIARLISNSPKLAADTVYEFGGDIAANVLNFFGSDSIEYKVAVKYASYINAYMSKPKKISFYRNSTGGVSAFLYGTKTAAPISSFTALSDASFNLSLGGISKDITVDLTEATSYADVSSAIQTAIRAADTIASWANATVAYISTDGVFSVTSGSVTAGEVILPLSTAAAGTDISGLLGLNTASAPIVSNGAGTSTGSELLTKMVDISNNFATFADLTGTLDTTQMAQFASVSNIKYMASIEVLDGNYTTIQSAVKDFAGTALQYNKFSDDSMPFIIPMAILASTDYDRLNGVVSYDFKQFPDMPVSVDNDTDYNRFNSLRINFYGATQQAGQPVAFYQHGYLQGSVQDIGVYANEIWLKDRNTTDFLNYMIAVAAWSADNRGLAAGDAIVINNAELAKKNGTILQGKPLNSTQKAYILSLTNDPDAWRNVQDIGYVLYSEIAEEQDSSNNGATIKVYKYTLIYSKGDIIRKVEGSHILI